MRGIGGFPAMRGLATLSVANSTWFCELHTKDY